jgi:hypothetical protein
VTIDVFGFGGIFKIQAEIGLAIMLIGAVAGETIGGEDGKNVFREIDRGLSTCG